ncbi:hypothetical protein OG539_01895 [Actinacidiphila glaucinigra]
MDTGRLPPQLAQLGDRRIALRLLLRPLRLTAGTVQLTLESQARTRQA